MNKEKVLSLMGLTAVFILSGCVVRTYSVTKDRTDQDLSQGNRGYLQGAGPSEQAMERSKTRTTQAVEIELHPPIRFERALEKRSPEAAASEERTGDQEAWGNRGYITQSQTPEIAEQPDSFAGAMEKYTVQKSDTLQKISQKFFGTTKKWMKIYEANQDTLKGPNKIYPGQVINIPTGGLKEPSENLK